MSTVHKASMNAEAVLVPSMTVIFRLDSSLHEDKFTGHFLR